MEEEITLDKNYKILIINNIKGNISRLNLILEKLRKNIEITYLFLTGEVLNLKTKLEDIYNIEFFGPTIIFDSSNSNEIIREKNEYNYSSKKNFIFLGNSGIFSPKDSSLNIAFLNGIEAKELLDKYQEKLNLPYKNKFYKYKDIDNILSKYLEKNKKIDFFLLNNFPQCFYNKYFNSIIEESENKKIKLNEEQINNNISYAVNYLLYIMNPRYVITSVDDFFYKNTNDNILNGAGYRTFFYNLAYLEGKQNIEENFYVALDYKSLNDMDSNEILNIEKYYEKEMDVKFIKNNNLFKYYDKYNFDFSKSLIQNFDVYLKLCFNDNKIKSIKELIPESKPLFLSNFSFNSSEEEIKKFLIDNYGPILMIKFLTNRESGKFNGKCIAQFKDINSMKNILENSNIKKFNDRIIKAVIYTPRDQLYNNYNSISNNNSNISFLNNNSNNINNQNNHINNNRNNTINITNINNKINNNTNNINKKIENLSLSKNNSNSSKNLDDCWFCYENKEDVNKRFILNEFDYSYLSFSKGPINKFHFLIIPKKHISFYSDLSNDEKIECEMIIKILKDFLKSKGCDYIIFEKNLKYNFNRSIHLLINVIGFENSSILKLNGFLENYFLEEKINNYNVIYNDLDLYLYQYLEKEEYIYINIPIIFKDKIIRKLFIIKTKEYKIDYPRKMICLFINAKDRINWRDTINSGDVYLDEIKKDISNFLDNFFSKKSDEIYI